MTERASNRLASESSPYLRQHAHNPVDWYVWGAAALSRAKAEDKPILLSIGYSACHWCHVMAHESFENAEIAALMNQCFINIKVDREERPDLDDIYQKAAQVFTGRGGGWPLTMFLTPEQDPFYGGTYFPPVPRYSLPAFPDVLRGVLEAYRSHKEEVQKNIERAKGGLRRVGVPTGQGQAPTEQVLNEAISELGRLFDPLHGGFGEAPKFPTVPPLNFLLSRFARTKESTLLDMVLLQLRKMAAGGMYDHLGGGFHRYSVDAEWKIPHFEKMLSDNAQLVRLYLDGWRLTKEERFRRVVEETLDFVRRELMHPDGAFFAAQDADSEGREGVFFLWTPQEIVSELGSALGGEFCRAYGVTAEGNFEGKNVLHRLEGGSVLTEEQERAESILKPAREKLLTARERRIKPQRDENILTGWNAMMISAMFDAGLTLNLPVYREAAEKALTFLLDYAFVDGRVYRTVVERRGRLNGYLDDAAWLAHALLDAFEATSHRWYLDQGRLVADSIESNFWDETGGGGCFFTSHDHEPLIQRMKTGTDSAIPSGNAVTASVFLRLFSLTGEERYHKRAGRILKVFERGMSQNPYASAALLCSADWWLAGPKEIVIVGARENASTEAMLRTVSQRFLPHRVVLVTQGATSDGNELPLGSGKVTLNGRPTAYVCHRQTCSQPVVELQQLEGML